MPGGRWLIKEEEGILPLGSVNAPYTIVPSLLSRSTDLVGKLAAGIPWYSIYRLREIKFLLYTKYRPLGRMHSLVRALYA
jgi:hypothetical protein